MADIVQFETGQPVEVALKFPEPRIYDGQYGERAMYTLTDGRVMYVDPLTAARIKSLGVQPGEFFYVLKTKRGRSVEWSVFLEGQEPPAAAPRPTLKRTPRDLATTLPERVAARNAAANLEGTLADSIALVESRKAPGQATAAAAPAPAPQPAPKPPARAGWTDVLLAQTNALTDVYASALAHASSTHGNAIKPEDIRALMTTAFINLARGSAARAA